MLTAHNQITLLTQHVVEGQELTNAEIEQAIHDLLEPKITLEVKAEFLLGLARRGETPREIAGFAILLRDLAIDPNLNTTALGDILVDTCGTGGSGANKTFNVSTASAFVLAAANIPVAKHGNRAITSKCGSADVLEALGIQIEMPPSKLRDCINQIKIGFLFAPQYHKAFKIIQPVRKYLAEKGKKSVFNLLGPLINPARPNVQIIGVYDPKLTWRS
jgi:anthranilate phosphoribosyltransferase